MNNWGITNLRDAEMSSRGSTIEVPIDPNNVIDPDEAIYWIAPFAYRGNKVPFHTSNFTYCGNKVPSHTSKY